MCVFLFFSRAVVIALVLQAAAASSVSGTPSVSVGDEGAEARAGEASAWLISWRIGGV